MANANRKQKHSFRVSFAYEVGSSFDPDMDKPDEWEHELKGSLIHCIYILSQIECLYAERHNSGPSSHQSDSTVTQDMSPVDLDDEEIWFYAEECAKRAVLADFEDIPEEELFSFSDVEEGGRSDEDVEMTH